MALLHCRQQLLRGAAAIWAERLAGRALPRHIALTSVYKSLTLIMIMITPIFLTLSSGMLKFIYVHEEEHELRTVQYNVHTAVTPSANKSGLPVPSQDKSCH